MMLWKSSAKPAARAPSFSAPPNWTSQRSDGVARLDSLHLQLLEEDLIDGIEVVNDLTYSVEALQLAFDHNLTIMGASGIHGLVDWQYEVPQGGHRPITLVFAAERSEAALKEALEAGQTVVWFKNMLIGQEWRAVAPRNRSIHASSGLTQRAEKRASQKSQILGWRTITQEFRPQMSRIDADTEPVKVSAAIPIICGQ